MLSVIINSELLHHKSTATACEVSVLWLRNRFPGNALLHWVIFVKPADVTLGTRHDVATQPPGIKWTYTSIPNYKMDAEERFLGYMALGSVKDGATFENIIKEVEVPKLKESRQDWVRKVVEEAVKAELLPESALSQLAKVPTRPQTEGT
jgi:hypothetical protein